MAAINEAQKLKDSKSSADQTTNKKTLSTGEKKLNVVAEIASDDDEIPEPFDNEKKLVLQSKGQDMLSMKTPSLVPKDSLI